jgi:hypothetical protein
MDSKSNILPSRNFFWIRPALLVFFIMTLAAGANATTAIIPSDDQMIVSSRAIVRGKVISQACGFDSRRDIVYTYVTLRIKEVLKGRLGSSEIVLKEPGGQIDSLGSVFFGSPRFTPGEEVVLYLDTWSDGGLRVHEMFLGKFGVTDDQRTGQRIAVRQVPGPGVEIIPLAPVGSDLTRETESTSRMELSAYLRMVRKKVGINAEKSRVFEDQYYRGQSMLARPPGYQDLVQSGGLQPQFHVFPFDTARWFEPDSGQPVTFLINNDQAPASGVSDDINAAMTAWSTVQGSSLRVVNGGSTTNCTVFGAGVADFDNCMGFFSGSSGSCQNVLAEGGFNYDPSQSIVVNGTAFGRIIEGFLSLNPFAACVFGDHCSLREVVTHEMGHSLGMGHSWDPSYGGAPTAAEQAATMFYIAHFDGRCASLKDDDMNGIRFIYPGSGGAGGGGLPPSISTTTLTSGTVGVLYNATLQASRGTTPYTWSIGTASGPLPPGLTLTPAGVIAGTPTTSGNFGFTVVVADAASHTDQADLSILISQPGGGGGAVGGYNSQFVSEAVATSVQPGQTFTITITWNNVGTASWTGGNVNLGSQDPPNNTTWGGSRLQFSPAYTVPSGVQVVMTFPVTAPSTPGVYQFQWQLSQDGGVGFFGDKSPNVAITVGTPSTSPPQVDTTVTPSAQIGVPYSIQLAASGGAGPYNWALSGGDLPPGLSLGLLSGVISGIPAAGGNYNFTVRVTDTKSATAQRSLVITVNAPPLSASAPALPTAITGTPYSQSLSATGGLAPYGWSITSGSLPAGLSLDPAAGTISGIPSAQGTFDFTVTVSDSQSTRATFNLNLHILVVGPDAVPHIDSAKYKGGPQKLIVTGQNFDAAAVAQVDGATVTIRAKTPTQLLIKPIALASGAHTITVVNPNGVPPSTITLTVN